MIYKNHSELINEIKQTITEFTSSKIDIGEAKKKYSILSKKYKKLSKISNNSIDLIKSICFNHNSQNFAIFTGLYQLYNNSFLKVDYCGDDSISENIEIILKEKSIQVSDKIFKIEIDGKIFYLNKFKYYNDTLVFITQTSSTFFKKSIFKNFSNYLITILPEKNHEISGIFESYEKIKKYLDNSLTKKNSILCYIFSFHSKYEIFKHFGYNFNFELNNKIIKILEHDYPEAKILSLSEFEYIVLINKKRDFNLTKESSIPKSYFSYKHIPLPFKTDQVLFINSYDFYKLIEKLHSLREKTIKIKD